MNSSPVWSLHWRDWTRADRRALIWFVLAPTLLFVIPALANHPAIDADNLIQNFPLRVLVGRQLDGGHLPLLNPYGNSGTPLLAGMNAGAAYPLTLLFAVLPAIAAWIINLVAVYVTCSLGVFSLLRWHGTSTRAAVFAAFAYAYGGSMIGQVVHLGVIQGFALLPWVILFFVSLARRLRESAPRGARGWSTHCGPWLFGGSGLWALVFLTGEPRAIAEAELLSVVMVLAVYLAPSSYRLRNARTRYTFALVSAVTVVGGVALAAVQLLPAWSYIHFSQRSVVTYSFFGAGSLAPRWSILFALPDALGGNGALGVTPFFAHYNLPEVTSYVGLLALCATAAFVARRQRRGWNASERDFTVYVAIAVVGLFASWGNDTVAGHLFRALPLFGSTRLQSRNAVLVDLGCCLLLGWWIDHLERRECSDRREWAALVPALGVAGLATLELGWGPWFVSHLGVSATASALATGLTLALVVHLVIALGALGILVVARRSPRLIGYLAVVLVVDLVTFSLFDATGLLGGPGPSMPSRGEATKVIAPQGRFALVDPQGIDTRLYRYLGEPNMNVFTGLASVQGYGALVSDIYGSVTGTHPQSSINECRVAEGTFRQLRLHTLVVASYLLVSHGNDAATTPRCAPVPTLRRSARYFGQPLDLRSVHVRTSHATASVRLQLLDARGRPEGKARRLNHGVVTWATPTWAAGVVVECPQPIRVTRVMTITSTRAHYFADGALDVALSSPRWRLRTTIDDVQSFVSTTVMPRMWLQHPVPGARVSSVRTSSWGDAWAMVSSPRPVVVVRSEAFLPGWRVTARNPRTGESVSEPVTRQGLVQRVRLPAGTWEIHYRYDAPYHEVGLVVSSVAFVSYVGLGWFLWRRRRE